MDWVSAGLIAAAFSFFFNRFLCRVYGESVLLGPVPLVEEVAKTMAALLLSADLIRVHLVFGAVEAVWDWHGEAKGITPAFSALVAHGVFGIITVVAIRYTATPGIGIIAALLAHAAWNAVMLFRTGKR